MASETADVKFSIKALHDGFESCLEEEDDIHIDKYIIAYKELYKFLILMGKLFSFVGSDIKSKLDILEEIRQSDKDGNFVTVKKMMVFEKEQDLLKKKGYVSGSRTFLRLHRGLDFISLFLQKVSEVDHKDGTATVCQEAYNVTLANHHTWVIRKAAGVAMYAMPTKENLLIKIFGEDEEEIRIAQENLPQMLEASREVHSRTQKLYEQHSLLDLP
ncbi:ceramide-1-phosphate transfer protein [Neocloeon triangulifer]|uniref:ceramide-1-phosphate transfer protein n=1 Tax=Neocloeon triangulifer TaxID=2078957 RepID=UPI00286F4F72|nr:ceramide-1-phosphate transfer protein [Neocloeon triangulifer]